MKAPRSLTLTAAAIATIGLALMAQGMWIKAKAALARLSATGANLLVMDEPTNHLDIWSCEALERSIR